MHVVRSLLGGAVHAIVVLAAGVTLGCRASPEPSAPGDVVLAAPRPGAPRAAPAPTPAPAPSGAAARRPGDLPSEMHQGGMMVRGPGPEVTSGTTSELTIRMIERGVRMRWASLRHCYDEPLLLDHTLRGVVIVAFTIDERGNVPSAAFDAADPADPRLEAVGACIARELQELSFPAPAGGALSVTYPIVVQPIPAHLRPTGRGGSFFE